LKPFLVHLLFFLIKEKKIQDFLIVLIAFNLHF